MSGIGGHTLPNKGRTDCWITPREIIAAVGPFDFDPCACDPQPWRTAAEMYVGADGLTIPWRGRVWLNPPYGAKIVVPWLARLAKHGHGTALIFARTDTAAFDRYVWGAASAVFFFTGRLFFHEPSGRRADHNAGGPSCLVAYGEEDRAHLEGATLRKTITGVLVTSWFPTRGISR